MSKLAPQRTALVRAFERRFGKAAGYSFSRSGTLYGVQDTATGTRLTGRFSAAGRLTVVSAYAYAPEPVAPPPAAPVASDPAPADVPAYLAVSTDGAGIETVMGVFRVAEHASADAAEMEAGKLCERIERAAPGAVCHVRANPDVNAAFADLATAEHTLRNLSADLTVWGSAFDRREAARERAVSLDPVRFVRTYPSQAYAFRHLLPADMVARIEAAEDDAAMRAAVGAPAMVPLGGRYVALADGGVEWVADAPTMVPQPAQQQQGRDMRRGMARCEVPGEWQIGIWCVTRQSGGTWEARATGPGTIGDGSPHSYPTLAAAYLGLTGEPMPGAASPAMVPQPCQPQQACAVRVTFQNDNPDTVWNKLAARLGRQPTNAEAAAEVKRILRRD